MLTQEQALAQLRGMVAWQIDPVLNDGEMDVLLTFAAVADALSRPPVDADWVPTYSVVMLNASAAEGWRWKAGKLTADKTHSDDRGNSWSPEQRRRDMLALADDYQRRIVSAQPVTGYLQNRHEVSGVLLN